MGRIEIAGGSLLLLLSFAGCGKSSAPVVPEAESASAQANTIAPTLQAVDDEIKAGKYDDAAAKLMGLRASGRTFNDKEGAEFRRALNDAYSQAVEAAAKGDPRGKVAMEMIRASGNH